MTAGHKLGFTYFHNEDQLTISIDPGIVWRNVSLSHKASEQPPISWQNFPVGMTFSN